jgi:uncharacterized protein (DUF2236 family)
VNSDVSETGGPELRVFSSDSMIWKISRENVLLLGGPCAAILQVAHPEIAAGVAAHSRFRADTVGRLHRTLEAVFTVTFATREDAERMKKRVAAAHAGVRGTSPVPYSAQSPEAQLWVLGTLIITAQDLFSRLVRPLSDSDRTAHYRDMRVFGTYFGLPAEYGAQEFAPFRRWYETILNSGSLGTHPICKDVASAIVAPEHPLWFRAVTRPLRGLAIESVPSPVREALGYRSTAGTRLAMASTEALLRRALPIMPDSARFNREYPRARNSIGA